MAIRSSTLATTVMGERTASAIPVPYSVWMCNWMYSCAPPLAAGCEMAGVNVVLLSCAITYLQTFWSSATCQLLSIR